ncbi:MAG: ubiquinol-cytochrome c reductase iron-sulfur subunit [Novosphingobium sp.]|nr:ubiquinol-cytochrome c reductase iron-sulfur subunit [Novosphingobium sp.]
MAQEAIIETPNPETGGGAPDGADDGVRRRDFINIAAVSFAGIGGVAALYPLISQMAPSADVLAESSVEIDIASIQPGQSIKAVFRKQPVFIRNLTPPEMAEARKVSVDSLRDPETLGQRTKPGKENWLITMGVCTHLGCVPLGAAAGEVKGEFGGYFCPCHGSHYDTAARIRKGPAPTNLEVPEYVFNSDTVVKIG